VSDKVRRGIPVALAVTVRRRQLASELRRLRGDRNAEEVGEAVEGWSPTKLSRAENAKVAVKEKEVTALLQYYGADEQTTRSLIELARNASKRGGWVQGFQDAVSSPNITDLATLEETATRVSTYEQSLIPGLFQTADYAREIIRKLSAKPNINVEARVAVRMGRQAVLTRPDPVEVWAVIHEAALCSNVGGPEVMGPQLDRVINYAKLPNVNIHVMPTSSHAHPGMSGSFTILSFTQQQEFDVVLVDGTLRSIWIEEADDVAAFHSKFRSITAEAMGAEDSLKFIIDRRDKIT
jgi:hypothetical protein